MTTFAVTNVGVFNGTALTDPTVVAFEDGTISTVGGAVPDGATIVDGAGGTLLPGLIDAHVHLEDGPELLLSLARNGVTTALDMASWPPARFNAVRGLPGVTDIRSAGIPATVAGSIHSMILPGFPTDALLSGADQAESWVAERVSEGSDYIKLIADVPGPDQPLLDALTAAAHRHDRLVVAHAARFVPYQMAMDAGVDVITHAPTDKPITDEMAKHIAATGQVAIPTLVMSEAMAPALNALFGNSDLDYTHSRRTVELLREAGVVILAGTDANAGPGSPAPISHGPSLHRELGLMVEAGMSPVDALSGATWRTAEVFGLLDRGAIQPGRRADLVLVKGDPTRDIACTQNIRAVWCAGVEVALP